MPLKNIWINWDKDPKNVWNSFWDRSNDKVVCRSSMSPMAFMLQAADLAFRGGSPAGGISIAHNEDVGQIQTMQFNVVILIPYIIIISFCISKMNKSHDLMIWKYYFLWSLVCFVRPASCSLRTNQPRASAASARGGPTHHKACGQGASEVFFSCLLSIKLWVQWLHLIHPTHDASIFPASFHGLPKYCALATRNDATQRDWTLAAKAFCVARKSLQSYLRSHWWGSTCHVVWHDVRIWDGIITTSRKPFDSMLSTAISFPYLPYCCIPFLFPSGSWLNTVRAPERSTMLGTRIWVSRSVSGTSRPWRFFFFVRKSSVP